MKYRKDRYGNEISILGFGCMRFTKKGGKLDFEKAEKEIMTAYNAGVNYYDTAYIYPGSEALIGEIFEKNGIRDKINIATKLPHYLLKNYESFDKYFDEELKRLRTDHVDYYLMHMLNDIESWNRIKGLGIEKWLEEKKKSGQIRQVGFSYHGNSDMFLKLIDEYDWDFCQIQYNYMDENSQAGRTGLNKAREKGIPVVIMEPLRGGKLVNLPDDAMKMIKKYEVKRTPAEWSFRWLYNQEAVTCVLSGMNSVEMVEENVKTASSAEANSFSEKDFELLSKVLLSINKHMNVGCTGCRYCMPCPKNVDIPGTFSAWNTQKVDGKFRGMRDHVMNTALRKDYTGPGNCVECGLCEKHCPQHIEIRKKLKEAKKSLETPVYKVARWFIKHFFKY